MAHLDVLFINPGGRGRIYQHLAHDLTAIEPPVWAGLMATFARKQGLSAAILDANAEGLAPRDVAERVADYKPILAAVIVYGHQPSASTQVMPAAGAICSSIKDASPGQPVLLAGGHVAALPERTLRDEAADYVCTGEGPWTVVDLVQALQSPAPTLRKVRGLCYQENGAIIRANPAPLVQDLNAQMPSAAWDLLPMERYRAHNWHCFGGIPRQPYAAVYTSLGCPYHCSFCCIQAPFKEGEAMAGHKARVNTYRLWSVESVLAQIDTLHKVHGVHNIKIADEMFVLNPPHVLGICDGLIKRNHGINLWAYARVDTIRPGMVQKLKAAGFNWLALGIEAASETVRGGVDKAYRQDRIFATVDDLRAEGINVIANYIFGLPDDDHTSMRATLDLALDLNTEFANLYSAMAYPGSPLYREALAREWPLPESWSGYSQHSFDTLPLPTKHLTAAEVLRFRDHAFDTYYANPRYLAMIAQKFGQAEADAIAAMAARPLERQYA